MLALERSRPLLLDGGMGTSLMARGLDVDREPTDLWNATHPEVVAEIHRGFAQAGASALQTNTFGANRLRLRSFGLEDQVRRHNLEGVRLARAEAPSGVLVIGSMGPTGAVPPPQGDADLFELEEAFAEQAAALAEGGVDLLHVETLYHPKEARAALRGCRQGAPGLAVVASMACRRGAAGYTTTMGFAAEALTRVLLEERADGIGVNCSLVPEDLVDLVRQLADRSPVPVFAKPTVSASGRAPLYPGEFGGGIRALIAAGAWAVGGCCGTSSADIAAARAAMESAPEPRIHAAVTRRYG